jgi:hypothetical protein
MTIASVEPAVSSGSSACGLGGALAAHCSAGDGPAEWHRLPWLRRSSLAMWSRPDLVVPFS